MESKDISGNSGLCSRIVYICGVIFIVLVLAISARTLLKSFTKNDPVDNSVSEASYDRGDLTEGIITGIMQDAFAEYDSLRQQNDSYVGRLIFNLAGVSISIKFEVIEPCGCPSAEEKIIVSRAVIPVAITLTLTKRN